MLVESEQMRKEADDAGPMAELQHWRQRMAKFNSLLEQLKTKQCRTIIGILVVAKSKVLKVGLKKFAFFLSFLQSGSGCVDETTCIFFTPYKNNLTITTDRFCVAAIAGKDMLRPIPNYGSHLY